MTNESKFKIGTRYLVRQASNWGSLSQLFEVKIKEISPSGNYVKAHTGGWLRQEDYIVIEKLNDDTC